MKILAFELREELSCVSACFAQIEFFDRKRKFNSRKKLDKVIGCLTETIRAELFVQMEQMSPIGDDICSKKVLYGK